MYLYSIQGPKLTFLGRHKLATDYFFQLPDGKMWLPKTVNKIFPSKQTTNRWKTLVPNFHFNNQNEENAFGAAMAIFSLMSRQYTRFYLNKFD